MSWEHVQIIQHMHKKNSGGIRSSFLLEESYLTEGKKTTLVDNVLEKFVN